MSEWKTEPLDNCLEVILDYRGKSPPKSLDGIPVLSAKVVKTTGLLRPIEQKIAVDFYPEWMVRGLPRVGDVVMTTEAPMGEVIQLDAETVQYALGQRIVCMRGKSKKLDNTFLRYLLTSPVQQAILASYATGTTVLGISQKALRSVPIAYPDLSEQQQIGKLLGVLDDKIELNRRMNGSLEEIARMIFKDWFVDFGPTRAKMEGRVPYLAGDVWSLFPDGLGNEGRPNGWNETPLTHFFEIIGGGTPRTSEPSYWDGTIPWFSVVDTPAGSDTFVFNTEKKISEGGLQNSSACLLKPGDTIISARGTVGNLAIAGQSMAFNQSCYGLRGINDYGSCFVFLAAKHFVTRFKSLAHGSVFSTITRQTFESVQLPAPGRTIADQFELATSTLFERIRENVAESRSLAATRDLLLPKLMSGEVRVRDAEKLVGEAI